MPRLKTPAWTSEDVATLRDVFSRDGIVAARDALPHRTWHDLQGKVAELDLGAPSRGEASAPRLEGVLLDEAVQLHESGWGFAKISRRLGFPDTTISNLVLIAMCARRGYTPAPRDDRGWLTAEGQQQVKQMIADGIPTGQIQLRLGVNASAVSMYRRGLSGRTEPLSLAKADIPGRAGTGKRARRLRVSERVAIAEMLRAGWADRHIILTLAVPTRSVQIIRGMVEEAGDLPANCPCGKKRGHMGQHADQGVRNLSPEMRKVIVAGLRQGKGAKTLWKETGVLAKSVRQIALELDVAGQLPEVCPCGAPRGHGGPCNGDAHAEIRRRYRAGYAAVEIAPIVGLHVESVWDHLKRLKRQGVDLGTCRCGQPNGHSGGCIANAAFGLSARDVSQIQQMIRERLTCNEISRRTGLSPSTVARYAAPVWDELFSQGVRCGCGRRLGHFGVCIETYDQGERRRGPAPMDQGLYQTIQRMLLDGVNAIQIRAVLEVSQHAVLRVLGGLTPKQKRRRLSDLRRQKLPSEKASSGRDVIAQIKAIVPKGLDPSVRDEVISELCLAVMQGDLTLESLKDHCATYVGKAFNQWASAFGPRSLNELMSDDGNGEFLDLYGDTTTAIGIDEIEIGGGS